MPKIKNRLGAAVVDLKIEDAIDYAKANGFRYIEAEFSRAGNDFDSFDPERVRTIRKKSEEANVGIGLHTLSAINMAEFSPFLSDAVDQHIEAYIDLAVPLKAEFIIVHAGYHFTKDRKRRMTVGLERLKRMGDYARKKGVRLLLENMNPEPRDAEVKYLAHDVEETRFYFDQLDPEAIGWSFTACHAHIIPVGVNGFFHAFGSSRLGQVRIADNRGEKEEHLICGEGTMDFGSMFDEIEASGYKGHYMLCLGSLEAFQKSRDYLLAMERDLIAAN